jgi:uncharacterized protein (DUF2141 family)
MRASPLALAAFVALGVPVQAGELVVTVTHLRSDAGEIGCALHSDGSAFPVGQGTVPVRWLKADRNGVTCRFPDLRPGSYAVAVSHDLNGNRKTDANLLGIPTEDWGVSNNVRPSFRAPTFQEATVDVGEAGSTAIEVRLGR